MPSENIQELLTFLDESRSVYHAVACIIRELEKDGFIYTVPGKGCFVAAKNVELLREEYLKQIEDHLEQIVRLAEGCNLTRKDITDMVAFAWEERNERH